MKLDVNVLRYLSRDDFRTLTAVEMGQKNHEVVPAQLIDSIAGLKHGGTFKCLKTLLRHKLVHHDGQKYDGYRLTTLGYDFLAIRALVARGSISGVGRQIGVGKESDVFEVADDEGTVMALKLHRLGRTSFRAVKSKRDYMRRGSHFSWLYLSRLAALKEFAFMKALGEAGLPVPRAIEVNRHAVLMSMVSAYPMVQVKKLENPRVVYEGCMKILVQLAGLGLVHCDFNEFNLLIGDDEELTLIDFPQMVSISHPNARELFERDVDGVVRFFERKLGYLPEGDDAVLERVRPDFDEAVSQGLGSIDEQLKASGFKKEHQEELDKFVHHRKPSDDDDEEEEEEEEESEEEDDLEEGDIRRGGAVGEGSEGSCSSEDDEDVDEAEDVDNVEMVGLKLEGGEEEEEYRVAEHMQQAVAHKAMDERRRAARRTAMTRASRNAMKGKNAGKKKGADNGMGGGGW